MWLSRGSFAIDGLHTVPSVACLDYYFKPDVSHLQNLVPFLCLPVAGQANGRFPPHPNRRQSIVATTLLKDKLALTRRKTYSFTVFFPPVFAFSLSKYELLDEIPIRLNRT